jgi:Family of unknown function (DUF6328)
MAGGEHDSQDLTELLTETRILLPGTQVFIAFLMMVPFTERFDEAEPSLGGIFLCTFFATLLALACFVMPAAYHRIARPIRHKAQFKVFVNTFVVAGLGAWSTHSAGAVARPVRATRELIRTRGGRSWRSATAAETSTTRRWK